MPYSHTASAKRRLSSECRRAKCSSSRTLLRCRCPMRCQMTGCSTASILSRASCTRFSPQSAIAGLPRRHRCLGTVSLGHGHDPHLGNVARRAAPRRRSARGSRPPALPRSKKTIAPQFNEPAPSNVAGHSDRPALPRVANGRLQLISFHPDRRIYDSHLRPPLGALRPDPDPAAGAARPARAHRQRAVLGHAAPAVNGQPAPQGARRRGWVTSRADGTSRRYRAAAERWTPGARSFGIWCASRCAMSAA